jgi:hypothetical protein
MRVVYPIIFAYMIYTTYIVHVMFIYKHRWCVYYIKYTTKKIGLTTIRSPQILGVGLATVITSNIYTHTHTHTHRNTRILGIKIV